MVLLFFSILCYSHKH